MTADELRTSLADVERALQLQGYAWIPRLSPSLATIVVGRALGQLVDVESVLPASGIGTVQTLVPRDSDASRHRYFGVYGRRPYPWHTDLAHWAVPPRFFILRCVVGAPDVATRLLSVAELPDEVKQIARLALFSPKGAGPGRAVLRGLAETDGEDLFRWDSLFLRPMNAAAIRMSEILAAWEPATAEVALSSPGDTLIVDNWRTLHARSAVGAGAAGRVIERAYLQSMGLPE